MELATIDRSKEWTVKDYLKLEEGLLAQLIDGNLIMSPVPTPKHQLIIGELYSILKRQLGSTMLLSPVDLYINEKNVLQPDLVYISDQKKDIISERGIEGTPDIVIEVISPSNSSIDKTTKREKYLDLGVTEYWIVDPGNETLEIYTPTDYDQPRLYLVKEGVITSEVSSKINFNLKEIF